MFTISPFTEEALLTSDLEKYVKNGTPDEYGAMSPSLEEESIRDALGMHRIVM